MTLPKVVDAFALCRRLFPCSASPRTDLGSDDLAGDDQFHATVLLSPFSSLIARDRHGLPKAPRCERIAIQPLFDEILTNSLGSLLGEFLIQLVSAGAISMPFNFKLQSRMS